MWYILLQTQFGLISTLEKRLNSSEISAFCIAWCAPKHSTPCLACVDVRESRIFLLHSALLYLKQPRNMLDINKIYHPPKMK